MTWAKPAYFMSPIKSTFLNTTELADKIYWFQLHVFQVCTWLFCTIPCIALVIYLSPAFMSFMSHGPQRSSMVVLKVMVVVPIVFLFMGLQYLANLVAAVFSVLFIRMIVRALPALEAPAALLQFYSDQRWLYQSRGTKHFPWWVFLWGSMHKNERLIRWCERLTAGTISLVYGGSGSTNRIE